MIRPEAAHVKFQPPTSQMYEVQNWHVECKVGSGCAGTVDMLALITSSAKLIRQLGERTATLASAIPYPFNVDLKDASRRAPVAHGSA